MNLRVGDRVLIVTDTASDDEVGRLMFEAALERGADAIWSRVRARTTNGEQLPEPLVAALARADLAALVTSWSATHSPGVIAAVEAGVRVLSMPGVRSDMLGRGALTADYGAVRELTERWGEHFARGSRVRVTTHAGTDLTADLGGWSRRPFLDDGSLPRGVGGVGNMPAGEVAVAPIEGTAAGRIITDLTISTTPSPLKVPVTIDVEEGRVVAVRGAEEAKQFEAALEKHGESSRLVAEIALGTNPNALHIGVVIEDEKCLGTGHVGFGHAVGLGGLNTSTIHADAIFGAVTLTIDGIELVRDGTVVPTGLRRESLGDMAGIGGRFQVGPAKTEVHDGALFAAWQDVRGRERLAQVGDEAASIAAAALLQRGRLEAAPGTEEAMILDLLHHYAVIRPVSSR